MGFEVCDLTTEIYDYQKQASKKILDTISLKVNPGEITAIIGEIGSGKSTFIQYLNGLKQADFGEILIQSKRYPHQSREWLQKVGIVQQFSQKQLFLTTVADEIRYAADNFQVECDMHKLCQLIGIDENLLDQHPRKLSGGQMRKVAIASVLSAQPEILVLDEPFAGLDWQVQAELTIILKKLAQSGITVLIVTHDLNFVYEHTQKVIVFSNGKIMAQKSPRELFLEQENWEQLGIEPPPLLRTTFIELDEQSIQNWLDEEDDIHAKN